MGMPAQEVQCCFGSELVIYQEPTGTSLLSGQIASPREEVGRPLWDRCRSNSSNQNVPRGGQKYQQSLGTSSSPDHGGRLAVEPDNCISTHGAQGVQLGGELRHVSPVDSPSQTAPNHFLPTGVPAPPSFRPPPVPTLPTVAGNASPSGSRSCVVA